MYRYIDPDSRRELLHGMLLHPTGDGYFQRACEADSWRGLVAAVLDDPGYETADPEDRLINRLRLAHDAALLLKLGDVNVQVGDRDGVDVINVASDESLVRSLDNLGIVSLEPSAGGWAS
jgi:hypothetical protein